MTTRDHGTRAKYVHDKCRCWACTFANRVWTAENAYARLHGDVDLMDAAPVREHMHELGEAGVGYKQQCKIAGVSKSAGFKIWTGTTARCRASTGLRLLEVTINDTAAGQYIDAGPAWAHVEELRALGYPKSWISLHIGQGGRALQLGKERCTKRNADAIKHLRIITGDMRYDFRSRTVEMDDAIAWKMARLLEGLPLPSEPVLADAPLHDNDVEEERLPGPASGQACDHNARCGSTLPAVPGS